jgi:homoserine dehydrogenase
MSLHRIPVVLIGFGNASRRLAELLLERSAIIEEKYHSEIVCTAISTSKHGSIASDEPIDLGKALEAVRQGKKLSSLPGTVPVNDAFEAIEQSRAEIMIETTPLNIKNGEPAISHIKRAFDLGIHVVTANKGPVAFAARDLRLKAEAGKLCFLFESTVMDGMPIFNLVERALPLVEVKSIHGIINSTTNYILTAMEKGNSYEAALTEAQACGVAEADPSLDVEGWDAAVKASVLANSLMNADISPDMVSREGITSIKAEALRVALKKGSKIRLVARIEKRDGKIIARVAPEEIPADDLLYVIDAYSNALILETDLMGTIAMVEQHPNLTQTAYGLLGDLLSIIWVLFR